MIFAITIFKRLTYLMRIGLMKGGPDGRNRCGGKGQEAFREMPVKPGRPAREMNRKGVVNAATDTRR